MEEFTKQVVDRLKEIYGDDADILTKEVIKNNDTRLQAVSIIKRGETIGMIRFDVVFYVRLKDGISQVIVNVEAQ